MAKEATPQPGTTGTEEVSALSPMEGASLIAALLPGDVVDDDGPPTPSKGEKKKDPPAKAEDEEEEGDEEAEEGGEEEEESTEESEDTEDEESEEEGDEDVFELTGPDGKTETLSKQELLDGYLRQADYTRKTQKAAEQRKAADAVAASAEEQRGQYAQQLQVLADVLKKAQPVEPDWEKLRREDPAEYNRAYTDWQRHQTNLKKVKDEQERVATEQQTAFQTRLATHLAAESEKLAQVMPEMADTGKAKALVEKWVEYGTGLGFSKEDLGQVTDHRLFVLLEKARRYDELQAKKPDLRRKIKGSKTIKPGARSEPSGKVSLRRKKALQAAKKTGRAADAAAAIADLLPEDVF